MIKIRYIWLLISALMTVAFFCQSVPAADKPGDPAWDKQVKDAIDKSAGKKGRHPKVQSVLTDLEDEYDKGGEEGARQYARKNGLKLDEKMKIKVIIKFDQNIPKTEQPEAAELSAYGIEVNSRVDFEIAAKIPANRIREIADKVKGVASVMRPIPLPSPGC